MDALQCFNNGQLAHPTVESDAYRFRVALEKSKFGHPSSFPVPRPASLVPLLFGWTDFCYLPFTSVLSLVLRPSSRFRRPASFSA
ncbi:MAG: hypothetical protein KEFWMYNX_001902 [Candidatus Fervidibacter sp.]